MNKRINPNLLKLAELTHNPDLKIDETILEKKVDIEPPNVPSVDGYIYIPSTKLYVAKERTLNRKDWSQTHKELHKQGLQMLTPLEFIEFIRYLKDGYQDRGEAEQILNEILTVRNPWRAEWLDAYFKVINGELHIDYNHRIINGKLKPLNSELLEDCLMEDKAPGIDLDYWLKNPTKQGLPRKDTLDGDLYYQCPMKEYVPVANLGTGSDGTLISFRWNPLYLHPSLGVHAAKTRD